MVNLAAFFAICAASAFISAILCAAVSCFTGRMHVMITDNEMSFRTKPIWSICQSLFGLFWLLLCVAFTCEVWPDRDKNSGLVYGTIFLGYLIFVGGFSTLSFTKATLKELRCDLASKTYYFKSMGIFGRKNVRGPFSDFKCLIQIQGPRALLRWRYPSNRIMLILWIYQSYSQKTYQKYDQDCKAVAEKLGIPMVHEWQ